MKLIRPAIAVGHWNHEAGRPWGACLILAISVFSVTNAWALDATPTVLSFQTVEGGASPSSQILNILKKNKRTLSWSSQNDATWLSVSPRTGTLTHSTQLSVSVNPIGLAAGTYTGTVTVSARKGGKISVPVTLTVTLGSASSSSETSSTTSPSEETISGSSSSETTPTSSSFTRTLTWNPSTSTDVAGYTVHMGMSSGTYSSAMNVGNVTSYAVSNLAVGNTYFFAVTAYDTSGLVSEFSNEVSTSIY